MRIRDENKEQLVHIKAIQLIASHGLEDFSMQKLAKAAHISPATLYIYYKDKEDLILKVGIAEGKKMTSVSLEGFDPKMSFADGLRKQWINRSRFSLENPDSYQCLEQFHNSPHHDKIVESIKLGFSEVLGEFMDNSIKNGELIQVPFEVFWAIAYAPLYTLIRFHKSGKSVGNRPFTFSDDIMNQTLELVLKALKP